MEDIEVKLFTIDNLKQWLVHNRSIEGLTNEIIAPARAYAFIKNPYVNDDDVVIAAIYDGGKLAAYTAAFPESYKGKRIWWFSTLYCKPEFNGKGYGLIAVGSLTEIYGNCNVFDMNGAEETVEIFRFLGSETIYVPQYEFGPGKIQLDSLKGKLAYLIQKLKLKYRSDEKALIREVSKAGYTIEYSQYVDDEAYTFIVGNSRNDMFVREQKMLNWIVEYPFYQDSPLYSRVVDGCVFSSKVSSIKMHAVKVRLGKELIGFYIMKMTGEGVFVKYLYYVEDYSDTVFLSVAEHFIKYKNPEFSTRDKNLASFVEKYKLTSKYRESKVSFSHPTDFEVKENFTLQSGDGDNFA